MTAPSGPSGPSLDDDDAPLRSAAGAIAIERDVICASGPDTIAFLQGQLSQDVAALPVGGAAWSFLLQPQGKVDAWLRIIRVGDDEVLLDVEGGWAEAVTSRLERFKLRTKFTLERLEWSCIAVRGPASAAIVSSDDDGVRVPLHWPAGVQGFDLLGHDVTYPEGVAVLPPAAYERLRVEVGIPSLGAELTEQTIPAEMGQWIIDSSVSFTKGCYTGQELVARIDSRGGNVPRHLRTVVFAESAPTAAGGQPPAGADIVLTSPGNDGKVVGRLTSVAPGVPLALALVQRSVDPPAKVVIRWDGGETAARVELLPGSLLS